ncbi:MAG: hypothetical protein JJU33_09565 [Phycisphaerales bacterium]|nr:hypothetical protein [Phycisphaerales bacterium]
MMRTTSVNHTSGARPGYTLIEILGVVVILILLAAFAVPGFNAMLRGSSESLADTKLRVAVANAKDVALQSVDGGDSAALFLLDPGGRVTIVACRRVGVHRIPAAIAGDDLLLQVGMPREIEVFVADPSSEPIRLPPNFFVQGFVSAGQIVGQDDTQDYGWYSESRYRRNMSHWMFPESGFYDRTVSGASDADREGRKRQSFFVRFESGTGRLASGDNRPALFYDPAPSTSFRGTGPWDQDRFRPDRRVDHIALVKEALASSVNEVARERLIGDRSPDTVLARPVSRFALYDASRMVGLLRQRGLENARIGSVSGSFYDDWQRGGRPAPSIPTQIVEGLNELFAEGEGASVFVVDRYNGDVIPVLPPEEGG